MEPDREHLLVFYALCRKESDGRYVFDAPYYGVGSQRSGLCHAADCELLDPALLTDTKRKIVYTEHYYPRVEETVARFNTKYIGGTAHELGHGLGLSHDDGSGPERPFGALLMGIGNLNYRQDVWGGGPPAYLARASALRLLSHPLITGSDRGRWDKAGASFESLVFSTSGVQLRIEGTITGPVPTYAVVAYVWPISHKTDHAARTFPVLAKGGGFTLDLDGLRPDTYHLKLLGLQANGATTTHEFRLGFDARGIPATAPLNAGWVVDRAERAVMTRRTEARRLLSDQAIAAATSPESAASSACSATCSTPRRRSTWQGPGVIASSSPTRRGRPRESAGARSPGTISGSTTGSRTGSSSRSVAGSTIRDSTLIRPPATPSP